MSDDEEESGTAAQSITCSKKDSYCLDENGNVWKNNKKLFDGYAGTDLASDNGDVYVLTESGVVYKNDAEFYKDYEGQCLTAGGGHVYIATTSGEIWRDDEKYYEGYGEDGDRELQDMAADGEDLYVLTVNGEVYKNDELLYEDYDAVSIAAADGNVYILCDNGDVYKNDEEFYSDYAPLDMTAVGKDLYVLTESGRVYKNDEDIYGVPEEGEEDEEATDMHEVQDWAQNDDSGLEETARFMFEKADENKNGSLDQEEVKKIFTELCANSGAPRPTDVLLAQAWDAMDTDRDSKVSYDEFKVFLKTAIMDSAGSGAKNRGEGIRRMVEAAMASEEGRAELNAVFKRVDSSGDGKISMKEWGAAAGKDKALITKYFGGATQAEMERIFKRIDVDGSGSLTWDEFQNAAVSLGKAEHKAAKKPKAAEE